MDNAGLALVVLGGGSLWVQETLEDLTVHAVREVGSLDEFDYARWVAYADEIEAVDIYVEWEDELLWAGELTDGSGIAPLLRSRDLLCEFAFKDERLFADPWDGTCAECKRLIGHHYQCTYTGNGAWECPRCGYISCHQIMPTCAESGVGEILHDLIDNGLPKYRAHVEECARQYEEEL